jgi:hypothetical protein
MPDGFDTISEDDLPAAAHDDYDVRVLVPFE